MGYAPPDLTAGPLASAAGREQKHQLIYGLAVDPGLDGDVYADQPYLYGPAASSMNTLHIGSKDGGKGDDIKHDDKVGLVFQEGGSTEGLELRRKHEIPEAEGARKKYFLNEEHRKKWEWEGGRTYGVDFFNPYLDFNGVPPS
jgi:hypothetical protein